MRRGPRLRALLVAVMSVALAFLAAACDDGATGSTTPSSNASSSATSTGATPATQPTPATVSPVGTTMPGPVDGGVQPEGFTSVAATATAADGTVCELCLWLADEPEERARGLMAVTDLGPADGMAFAYDSPTATAFFMLTTPMPLSIAFFASDGAWLGAFDMAPCAAEPCTRYPTPQGFTVAVEVPQGQLDALALGAGSTLVLGAPGCAGN